MSISARTPKLLWPAPGCRRRGCSGAPPRKQMPNLEVFSTEFSAAHHPMACVRSRSMYVVFMGTSDVAEAQLQAIHAASCASGAVPPPLAGSHAVRRGGEGGWLT
jgi:hypothetical protein